MKRLITFFLALIIFAIPACALENLDFSLSYTEDITLYSYENVNSDNNILGMDAESFKKYLKDNNIQLLGVDNNNEFVFEFTSQQTEFSSSVRDFKNLKENDVKDFADSMKFNSYLIESLGDTLYIVSEYPALTVEKSSAAMQYVTITQGRLYVITFTAADGISLNNINRIDKIVSGITYSQTGVSQNVSIWTIIGVSAVIILLFGVTLYIIITIIRDIRKRNR